MKKDLFASEERIDILQGQVSGLRVEEVDERKEEEVKYAKIDVGFIADAVDADGSNFDDQEGEDPVGGCGQRGSARTDCKRGVFGRHYRSKKGKSVTKNGSQSNSEWILT